MSLDMKNSNMNIKEKIIQFLNNASAKVDLNPDEHSCGNIHGTSLVLATSYKDLPRATPLEFFNEGLELYIFGSPGGKIANIKKNNKVAAAIYEQPLNHARVQKSLQIFGEAELITARKNPSSFREKAHKWNQYEVVEKLLSPMIKRKNITNKDAEVMAKRGIEATYLIKISPNHIILREHHEDFSVLKFEWKSRKFLKKTYFKN